MNRHDDLEWESFDVSPQANEWQEKRGYDPNKATTNRRARFHANGKYATGKYKKWLEEKNGK